MKCIKYKCKYYFESDIHIKCSIADKYIKNGNCIGINFAKKKAEDIQCEISKMITEFNNLKGLEKFVKGNQQPKVYHLNT